MALQNEALESDPPRTERISSWLSNYQHFQPSLNDLHNAPRTNWANPLYDATGGLAPIVFYGAEHGAAQYAC
jgi:hypothetical protein